MNGQKWESQKISDLLANLVQGLLWNLFFFSCKTYSNNLFYLQLVYSVGLFFRSVERCITRADMCPCAQTSHTWWTSLAGRWATATGWKRSGFTLAQRTVGAPSTCSTARPSLERWGNIEPGNASLLWDSIKPVFLQRPGWGDKHLKCWHWS